MTGRDCVICLPARYLGRLTPTVILIFMESLIERRNLWFIEL